MYSVNSKPSSGVSFRNWVSRIQELCEDQDLELPSKHLLQRFYREDFAYLDVVNDALFKERTNTWMELHVRHPKGVFDVRFNTTAQAKDFFRKHPYLRDDLDK